MTFRVPEKYRVKVGHLASTSLAGCNGLFIVEAKGRQFAVFATDGGGWEHVSVSLPNRTPTWEEMCAIKAMFWDEEDCVVQYHPPKSEYVNCHPFCLHMWRPNEGQVIAVPPSYLVGPKMVETAGAG